MSNYTTIFTTVWSYFMTEFTVAGVTVSYGIVYLFVIMSTAVVSALKYFFFD